MTAGHEVTSPFDAPFFTGQGPETDDYSLPVSLDGRGFQLDTASDQFQRKSIKLLNTQQAQTGQDYALESPTIWRRATETWHSGADQSRFDRSDAIDSRYHRSVGIDPWTKYGFSLLPATYQLLPMTGTQRALLVAIGKELFVAIGTDVAHYITVADTAPTHHTLPAPVVRVTSDGENFYALCSNGDVVKRIPGGGWSTFYTEPSLNPTKSTLAYVKGFLVIGNGQDLRNITSGSSQLIYHHPLAGWWWRDVTDGLTAAYVLGGMGDRWHIHQMTVDKTGSILNPPIVAATLPDGEVGYAVGSYMGFVMIGTSMGWRFAMPDSSGALTYGQLIETVSPVMCFEGQSRFVWFGLSVASASTRDAWNDKVNGRSIYSSYSGLGRADLSVFVAPLTPAAASDINTVGAFSPVPSVVTVGGVTDGLGKRVYSVDGTGVYVESDELVENGWLSQGVCTFNSTDKKVGLYAQVFHEALAGAITVEVAIDTDSTAFIPIGHNEASGTVSVGNMPFTEAFNGVEMRYRLYRDPSNTSEGPRVVRAEFRAIDVPGRATEWHIPLLIFEATEWDNTTRNRDVVSDYDFLMELIRTRRQFIYREGDRFWTLHASDFVWVPDRLASNREAYQGTFLLIAREIT